MIVSSDWTTTGINDWTTTGINDQKTVRTTDSTGNQYVSLVIKYTGRHNNEEGLLAWLLQLEEIQRMKAGWVVFNERIFNRPISRHNIPIVIRNQLPVKIRND